MKRTSSVLLAVVIAIGTLLSLSLLFRHLAIPYLDACSIISAGSCDQALASDFAIQLGIPLAGWGLVFYLLLSGLLALRAAFPGSFAPVGSTAALLLTLGGALFASIILSLMLLRVLPSCPICIAVHLLNMALPWLVVRSHKTAFSQLGTGLRTALRYLSGGRVQDEERARWNLAGLLLVFLIGLVGYQWILLEFRTGTSTAGATADSIWNEYQAAPRQAFELTSEDPSEGPADAPVQIVLFSDFQCPFCRSFAGYLKPLLGKYRNQVRIVFKHFPLSPQCNPVMAQELHPLSCQAALLAQSAHSLGLFWRVHDEFFAHEISKMEDLNTALQRAGVDLGALQESAMSPGVRRKLESDVNLGVKLKIPGTPAVFLNGRLIKDARQLEHLLSKLTAD